MIKQLKKLFNVKVKEKEKNDLTPRGIKSTVNHLTVDFNDTFNTIFMGLR